MMPGNGHVSSIDDTIGGRMSLAREAKALSLEDAARQLGVLPSTWNAWECDRDAPRANKLTMMAGILGVSPSWLLTGLGEGPQEQGAHADPAALRRAVEAMSQEVATLSRRIREIELHLAHDADTSSDPASNPQPHGGRRAGRSSGLSG